ncbi:MAG: hypothetical protein EZS26_003701 [Candidatus Ordinivivax streblomastigis]|uniref:YggT family protein n=1 Tax=Candidatus Ordinivivax streblomastigis TaxID=2540710 RepID=A0A5M8NUW6_9BACT|nr:MAG: hypothetical protein EZS26_003701 [Candidatus Ordinivivax streblomastigis]
MILKVLAGALIVLLYLYKQIKPHKNALFPKHQKWFSRIERVFDTLLKIIPVKPHQLGNGLAIDVSAIIFLLLFILLLIV